MTEYKLFKCTGCPNQVREDHKFCSHCGASVVIPVENHVVSSAYRKVLGTWHVTTEGDCEGKSTRDLGIHTGYVDEIARSLGAAAMYSLQFKALTIPKEHTPDSKVKQVSVSFDIDSKTWDLTPEQRFNVARRLFKDRPVRVSKGQYYASFILEFD